MCEKEREIVCDKRRERDCVCVTNLDFMLCT